MGHTTLIARKRQFPKNLQNIDEANSNASIVAKEKDRVFGYVKFNTPMACLAQQRKKIAKKLADPRIAKIHFHLIRHWFDTIEYHKTHDLVHVQRLLGHKSILNTMI
jgi:integrase